MISCGFELAGSVVAAPTGMEIHSVAGAAALSIQTGTVRSGTYALRVNGLASEIAAYAAFRVINTATTGPYFSRAYVYFATFPSAENRFLTLVGSTFAALATIDNSGNLKLYDEDGLIGTAPSPLSTGTWYRIEFQYDASGAGANDTIVRLYLDGTEVAGATNRATVNTVRDFRVGGNLNGEAQTTGDWFFDDIAVNNSSGAAQTGLPGAGNIVHIWPDGDGDADTVVTRSSGSTTPTGTDRGANWQQLGAAFDKPTPNDITDFLLLTGNTSEVLVACESSATAGIGASDSVTLVHVCARIRGVSTSGANWIPRIMSQSAGTKVSGSTTVFGSTTFSTNDDTVDEYQPKLTQYVDPQAGGPWTPSLLDSMQIGAATTDGNPDTLVTALWALVEYVPAVFRRPLMVNQTVNRAGTY